MPKKELLNYLSALPETQHQVFSFSPDCYLREVAPGVHLASTLDFFYPLVDDPFLQGQIAAANVMSDLFAMGVTRVDHFLAILTLSTRLTEAQRTEVATGLMRGLDVKVREAGGRLAGGQTVLGPWVTIGGSAVGFLEPGQPVITNTEAEPGDKIVLTKPLGTQIAVNFAQYFRKDEEKKAKLTAVGKLTVESFAKAHASAVASMARLNLNGARVMSKLGPKVKASTDVTGFGLRGHAENLVVLQKKSVDFRFTRLPVFEGLKGLDNVVRNFRLAEGLAAETSGGLLIVAEPSAAESFRTRLKEQFGEESWEVGVVEGGTHQVVIDGRTEFFDA